MDPRLPEDDRGGEVPISDLPSALERHGEIAARFRDAEPAFFLDYDGTLAPIVEKPGMADLSRETRAATERLAARCSVAIVSGRDLEDVRRRVGIEGVHYAGSHGLDIADPTGGVLEHGAAGEVRESLPLLDEAEAELRAALADVPGAEVERKRFAIAVHYRRVAPERLDDVRAAADEAVRRRPGLRVSGGKKIHELRPAVDWHKGRAVLWLLERLEAGRDRVPVCLGDDVTDEDAFRAIADRGVAIVVGEGERRTSARYALRSPSEVAAFLDVMAAAVSARGD